ncbi:MAG: hypothetical protein ACRD3D_06550 [Terriglobia bacterium]
MRPSDIQPGQIWRSNDAGDEWLVTRTYAELFDRYAVLRRMTGAREPTRRVKIRSDVQGAELPGFSLVQG